MWNFDYRRPYTPQPTTLPDLFSPSAVYGNVSVAYGTALNNDRHPATVAPEADASERLPSSLFGGSSEFIVLPG